MRFNIELNLADVFRRPGDLARSERLARPENMTRPEDDVAARSAAGTEDDVAASHATGTEDEDMTFADALRNVANMTTTENGAVALRSTRDARLDLYATIGALHGADKARIERLFAEAYDQDPLFATRIVFYARDVRGGLGERETFRTLIRYMAQHHPEALRPNLDLIGVYGRYDDLYALVGTPLEDEMWAVMKAQFEEDRKALARGEAVSLLAKWIKTADASSENTRRLGILTARKLGYPVYTFKREVRALRRQIGIVEAQMSAGKWDEIKYSAVPSRAMMIYRSAFQRHDEDRYNAFINAALTGTETIHSGTLYPYDIVEKFLHDDGTAGADTLEAQWRQLPDYVSPDTNALVIADVSGSMTCCHCRPLAASIGLAIYFAERNKGAYHNLFMEFSSDSNIVELQGETLAQKISSVRGGVWGYTTNLKGAFERVLGLAVAHHVPQAELPKALIVISDMEIDSCGIYDWTFYDYMEDMYRQAGYTIPNIIFWNVNSRSDVFHADASRRGVQLVSGQSASTFKQIMDCVDLTPVEAMERVIGSERYAAISIA